MRTHRPTTRTASIVVVAACLTLLAGCGTGGDDETLDEGQMAAEYRAAADALELPAGSDWNGPDFYARPDTVYMPGVGTGNAQWEWICHWQVTWLEVRSSDDEAAERALEQLRTAPDLVVLKEYSDAGTRELFAEQLEKAELGDPSGIQNDTEINCGHVGREG